LGLLEQSPLLVNPAAEFFVAGLSRGFCHLGVMDSAVKLTDFMLAPLEFRTQCIVFAGSGCRTCLSHSQGEIGNGAAPQPSRQASAQQPQQKADSGQYHRHVLQPLCCLT